MADIEVIDHMWEDYAGLYSAQGWGDDDRQAQLHAYVNYVAEIINDDNYPPMNFLDFVQEQFAIGHDFKVEVATIYRVQATSAREAAALARARMEIEGLPVDFTVQTAGKSVEEIKLEARG